MCSIPEIRGRKAIQAARQRGDLPAQVLYNALVWLAYCQEPGSARITNHAYLIAARIQDGTPPPKSYRPSKRSSLWPRIVEAKRRWTQQLAERHSGQRARSGPDTEAPEAAVF